MTRKNKQTTKTGASLKHEVGSVSKNPPTPKENKIVWPIFDLRFVAQFSHHFFSCAKVRNYCTEVMWKLLSVFNSLLVCSLYEQLADEVVTIFKF